MKNYHLLSVTRDWLVEQNACSPGLEWFDAQKFPGNRVRADELIARINATEPNSYDNLWPAWPGWLWRQLGANPPLQPGDQVIALPGCDNWPADGRCNKHVKPGDRFVVDDKSKNEDYPDQWELHEYPRNNSGWLVLHPDFFELLDPNEKETPMTKPQWTPELVAEARNPEMKIFAALSPACRELLHWQANEKPNSVESASCTIARLEWMTAAQYAGKDVTCRRLDCAYRLAPGFDPLKKKRVELELSIDHQYRLRFKHRGAWCYLGAEQTRKELRLITVCRGSSPAPTHVEVDE